MMNLWNTRRTSKTDAAADEETKMMSALKVQERLLKERKLILLVDLDSTLVHSKKFDTEPIIDPNIAGVFKFQVSKRGHHHNHTSRSWFQMKLRIGVQTFLTDMSKLFDMYIFTFGSRSYAETVVKFVDPTGEFFSNRIISRDDCKDKSTKIANLKDYFPHGDQMVCIIDDREDVWKCAPNLIAVKSFRYFKDTKSRKVRRPGNTTEINLHQMECVEEGQYFDYLEKSLREVHSTFFRFYEYTKADEYPSLPDVKNIIPLLQQNMLI